MRGRPAALLARGLTMVLLGLAMPIMLLGTAGPAAAAITGAMVELQFGHLEDGVPGNDASCELQANWESEGTSAGVRGALACSWLGFMGFPITGVDVLLTGETPEGTYCSATLLFGSPAGDGTRLPNGDSVASYGSFSATGQAGTCHIDEACWEMWRDPWPGAPELVASDCEPFDLGAADVPGQGACAFAEVNRPLWEMTTNGVTGGNDQYKRYKITFRKTALQADTSEWFAYALMAPVPTAFNVSNTTKWVVSLDSLGPPSQGNSISLTSPTVYPHESVVFAAGLPKTAPAQPTVDWQIIGLGMVRRSSLIGPNGVSTSESLEVYKQVPQQAPGAWDQGAGTLGVTDGARCSFYWGTKVASITTNTQDEPLGPVGGPAGTPPPVLDPTAPGGDPADEDEGCGFSITDPSSWASAGICALVGLFKAMLRTLGKILGVLGGLVVSLIGALGELVEILFIPDPSSWGVDGVMTQVKDAGPTAAIGEVTSGLGSTVSTYQSAGNGCGVLFSTVVGDDTVQGNTCDTAPMLAALRTLVAAALVILTGIGVVKMLGGVLES